MLVAFLNYLTYEKRYSPKTVESYQTDLQKFFLFQQNEFQQADITQTHNRHIRTWVVALVNSNIQPASVKRKISALKSFFKYLQKTGKIQTNPAAKIVSPKIPDRLPKFVAQKDLNTLLEDHKQDKNWTNQGQDSAQIKNYFSNDFFGRQENLIIDVLYSCGLRRSELIHLKWMDVNLGTKQIKVTGKGNKQRLIPISSALVAALTNLKVEQENEYKDKTKQDYVFLTKDGNQLYDKFVYRLVKEKLTLCTTVEKKSPHVLRHSFATHMSNNGAKLNDIKELMGHASLASTQVYTHNTIEQLKEIYKIAHPKS